MAHLKTFGIPTREDLQRLLEERDGPFVSIYLPVHRFGPETELDKVRMKNLLSTAEERLRESGLRRPEAEGLLGPASDLLDDGHFWQRQLDGLAVFAGPGGYVEHFKLPYDVDEDVAIDAFPHVRGLLPALSSNGQFFILALSRGAVRLLRGTKTDIEEVDLSEIDMPKSFDEALQYDDYDKGDGDLQHRSSATIERGGGQPIFHGQVYGSENLKRDMQRYFHGVNAGLSQVLRGESVPLVLAAVEEAQGFFRQIFDYKNITGRGIVGNPDHLKPEELHAKAWPLVEPIQRAGIDAAKEKFLEHLGTGLATCDLTEALVAAHGGRVETLFLRRGEGRWGGFDLASGTVEVSEEPQPGQTDLLDLAMRKTFQAAGNVFLLTGDDMPCDGPIGATYRY